MDKRIYLATSVNRLTLFVVTSTLLEICLKELTNQKLDTVSACTVFVLVFEPKLAELLLRRDDLRVAFA